MIDQPGNDRPIEPDRRLVGIFHLGREPIQLLQMVDGPDPQGRAKRERGFDRDQAVVRSLELKQGRVGPTHRP